MPTIAPQTFMLEGPNSAHCHCYKVQLIVSVVSSYCVALGQLFTDCFPWLS